MTDNVRKRTKQEETHNGFIKQEERKNPELEFTYRESPLTVLIEGSLHIRVIYNIFVVILMMLLFNTVVYDLVEHGKQVKYIQCS